MTRFRSGLISGVLAILFIGCFLGTLLYLKQRLDQTEWLAGLRGYTLHKPRIVLANLCDETDQCTLKQYQVFTGSILKNSLRDALATFNQAGEKDVLVLDSAGGDMDMLATIRQWVDEHPAVTLMVVGSYDIDDAYWGHSNVPLVSSCQSACAFWFTMANKRAMLGNPRRAIMIHPPFHPGFFAGHNATRKIDPLVLEEEKNKTLSYMLASSADADRSWRKRLVSDAFSAPLAGRFLSRNDASANGLITAQCEIVARALRCN